MRNSCALSLYAAARSGATCTALDMAASASSSLPASANRTPSAESAMDSLKASVTFPNRYLIKLRMPTNRIIIISSLLLLLTKSLFSHREGLSINHDACLMRVDNFILIIRNYKLRFPHEVFLHLVMSGLVYLDCRTWDLRFDSRVKQSNVAASAHAAHDEKPLCDSKLLELFTIHILPVSITHCQQSAYKWPLLTKSLFSYAEGLSINHHTCSMQVGDFKLIIRNYKPRFPHVFFHRLSVKVFLGIGYGLHPRSAAEPRRTPFAFVQVFLPGARDSRHLAAHCPMKTASSGYGLLAPASRTEIRYTRSLQQ
uniref:SFRICE_000589 n=1 Tax=Spodoptera frugiperda TaxID=7108 RepID=A0A2H1V9K9_SPOFR